VTPEGILSCLRFPLLRRFDYVSAARVSKSFVLAVLSQNPNLKSLAVNLVDDRADVLKEIQNRRLTLVDLVIIFQYLPTNCRLFKLAFAHFVGILTKTCGFQYDRESGSDSDCEADNDDAE